MLGIFLAGVLFALGKGLPLFWYHRSSYWDHSPSWWGPNQALWRGCVRAMPAWTIGGLFLALAAVSGATLTPHAGDSAAGRIALAIPLALVGACALFFVMGVGAILLNRPKVVVPPHLRDEPGVFADRANRRQAER